MPLRSTKDYSVGILYFILFILTIPAMNWVVMNVGTVCTADGPCLIPVWPGIMAPSGVLMAGVALVLRDGLQAKLGVRWSLYAIIIGAALSALFSEPSLVLASVMAFFFSDLARGLHTDAQEMAGLGHYGKRFGGLYGRQRHLPFSGFRLH